ncbi:nitroreductase family protein [Hoylesella oralis]|uniref:nitroreductase family protein n=1 Tax=Hoylesella oralis TaxID=28134 RepID=UPI0028E619F6|nr:nitroreductase family protein [Hoylesella oralis]
MTLQEIIEHRRAVRLFDASKPLDAESVRHCIELATLAPTSSNMQLWECYHITDKDMLHKLATACLEQRSAADKKAFHPL